MAKRTPKRSDPREPTAEERAKVATSSGGDDLADMIEAESRGLSLHGLRSTREHERQLAARPPTVMRIGYHAGAIFPLDRPQQPLAGVPVPEPIGYQARRICDFLKYIGSTETAPQPCIELAARIVHAFHSETHAVPWQTFLVRLIHFIAPAKTIKDARGSVDWLLASLRLDCPDVPKAMREPTALQLSAAAKALLPPPAKRGPGRRRTPQEQHWANAVAFSRAFGLGFPVKPSLVNRVRTD